MPEITLDITSDEAEGDGRAVDIEDHGLNDFVIHIDGSTIVLKLSQMERLYNALRPFFDETAED